MILEIIKTSQKLEQILLNFIDVLRINILIVDSRGNPVLVPKTTGHGFNGSIQWGVLQYLGTPQFLEKFEKEGHYLKITDIFGFYSFALPIAMEGLNTIGYLVVGPVILNKQLELSRYQAIADKTEVNFSDFLSCLNEVRVLSFNGLKSILDLLFETSQYALRMKKTDKRPPATVNDQAQITHSIFTTLLDLSMALTQAECGSIMLFNKITNELNMEVHKGLSSQYMGNVSIKLGEGIAGIAAQEKTPFVINEEGPSSNRIKHLLKKPELKCAVVLPIIRDLNQEVLGVINIATHQDNSKLATHSEQMLKTLTNITSSTLEQIF